MARAMLLWVVLLATASPAPAQIEVDYVGHASFVIRSPGGVRIVLDPFSSSRWLGYEYPQHVEADVVLVSHPHYDHDASYYWGDAVPVFRAPGRYRVGDVVLDGIEGRHADPYGRDFGRTNTIWVVETGGVRVAHLGDNGPLTGRNIEDLGRIDVLMLPADGDDHILKRHEIAAMRDALGDPLVVPMHYRLDGFHDLPRSLGPLDPWLEGQQGVVRLETHHARLDGGRHPERRVLVFRPSPDLEPWGADLVRAWEDLDRARSLSTAESGRRTEVATLVEDASAARRAEAARLVEEAYEGSGGAIVFAVEWARVLSEGGDQDAARRVLEAALAAAGQDDWEYRMRAHDLLATLYERAGDLGRAIEQYRLVLTGAYRLDLIDRARQALERLAGSRE